MADLTREDVLKLAQLSKLSLTEEEVEEFIIELNETLKYVEQLQSIDTDSLKPTNQVTGLTNVMRKDEVKDYGISQEQLLKNLPDRQGNQIKVRRVL